MPATKPKYVKVMAKCSDCCCVTLEDAHGNVIEDHDGYVPSGPFGGGDYIQFTVDNETGYIRDWQPMLTLKENADGME